MLGVLPTHCLDFQGEEETPLSSYLCRVPSQSVSLTETWRLRSGGKSLALSTTKAWPIEVCQTGGERGSSNGGHPAQDLSCINAGGRGWEGVHVHKKDSF